MDVEKLFNDSVRRRWWLLVKASECRPLDQALDLAREAERFVSADADTDVLGLPATAVCAPSEPASTPNVEGPSVDDAPLLFAPPKGSRLPLSPQQRDQLLERLSQGANNATLAAEFGLAPKQVQGIRMSVERMAGRQRQAHLAPTNDHSLTVSIEEVVRYLRQQDDVVVTDGKGAFLVNARFNLSLSELVAKANRARLRQNKPAFKVAEVASETSPPRLGQGEHPMFWKAPNDEQGSSVGRS